MSATASLPVAQSAAPASKSKKKNKKKSKNTAKSENASENANTNGDKEDNEPEADDIDVQETEIHSTPNAQEDSVNGGDKINAVDEPSTEKDLSNEVPDATERPPEALEQATAPAPMVNGAASADRKVSDGIHSQDKFDALVKDRDILRAEVEQLRKSLEEIQEKHEEELSTLRTQAEEAQEEKEHAESQYRTLLGRVNTIKSTLGERLKQDAEELSQAKGQIEELEQQNQNLQAMNSSLQVDISQLRDEAAQSSRELSSLRNRTNLSQQNWAKEREDLLERERFAKEEFQAAKQAMQEWEVVAMEERSAREELADRVIELEEQLSGQKEDHEKIISERDTQASAVDGLQRALQEIQEARRQELREIVGSSQSQVEELGAKLQEMEKKVAESDAVLEQTKAELARALPFEKEVKEKNLLIGKLRHEAVILNDHLTKALRFLRKGKPEENVDRQIVTNHFLHFLALDRADPKKFQILQLIAALLNWNEEEREQAGLARPGTSYNSLRLPLSPFHRTPSTPAFPNELFPDPPTGANKESLSELWSDFLEREAQEGAMERKDSRSASISSVPQSAKSP